MKDGQLQIDVGTANHLRSLFKPSSWLSKIDFINHLVLFNNVLVTVLSEKSGGKTSFSTLLLNNLDKQIKPVFMTITPPCDREKIISDIAAQLHLNVDSDTNITSIVSQINERKAYVLLIIDDAQHLPESLIRELMLIIKGQDNFGFFHLCLVSDYSIVATLNSLVADQFSNLIHTIELSSLNESETRTYVLQRAMNERLINRPLTDAQYKQFYQLTKGNLSKINSNLESFILNCSIPKKKSKLALVKRISMAASAVIISGISYIYFSSFYQTSQPSGIEISSTVSVPVVPEMKHKIAPVPKEQLVSYIPSYHEAATVRLVHFELPRKQVLDDPSNDDQLANTVAIVDKVIVIPTVKTPSPTEMDVAQSENTSTAIVKDARRENITSEIEKDLRQTVNTTRPLEKSVRVTAKNTSPTTAPKPPVKLAKRSLPVDIAHLIKPAPSKKTIQAKINNYTIQLAASHNMKHINRLKGSSKTLTKAKVRHFTNAKGKWYVLTIGEFSSVSKARSEAKKLPMPLAKLNPWIRSVNGLANVG